MEYIFGKSMYRSSFLLQIEYKVIFPEFQVPSKNDLENQVTIYLLSNSYRTLYLERLGFKKQGIAG